LLRVLPLALLPAAADYDVIHDGASFAAFELPDDGAPLERCARCIAPRAAAARASEE